MSGARFRSLRPYVAVEFFDRLVGWVDPKLNEGLAWGGFEDRTELIAACAMAPASKSSWRLQLAVIPERRRLGIGSELLHIATAEAGRRGARQIVASYRTGAIAAAGLFTSFDAIQARRVCCDDVEVVVFLPAVGSPAQGGTAP